MELKGIIIWAVFLAVVIAGILYSRRLRKRIDEQGIEAIGEISRVSVDSSEDGFTQNLYVRYRDQDGREQEAMLLNVDYDIIVGTRVRIRYHEKNKRAAVLVRVLDN